MPLFTLYHFNDNFSEYIQDDTLNIEERAVLSLNQNVINSPAIHENSEFFEEYVKLLHGIILSSPWSKGGVRHLVPRILSDLNDKNRKE